MLANLAVLSLIPLLATSVSAATLPFRYSKVVARSEQVLANGTRYVSNNLERRTPKTNRKKRYVRRERTKTCYRPSSSTVAPGNTTLPSSTDGHSSVVPTWTDQSSARPVPTDGNSSVVPSWTGESSGLPVPTDSYSSVVPTSTGESSAIPVPTDGNNNNNVPDSEWTLWKTISGQDFFDSSNWYFFNYDDPTHGEVDYVDSTTAWNNGLVSVDSQGNAIMKVETTPQTGKRQSVRLHSSFTFNGGLVLMDASHMPTGCGTWPAWWENGPDWPTGGEIDILEGVNDGTVNQVSLHTAPGCTMPNDFQSGQRGQLHTGNFNAYDCSAANTGNQGCGVIDNDNTGYGEGFNSNGGGVYALQWDNDGIAVWFLPRDSIPADVTSNKPNPANWGTPVARFPATTCDPFKFFYDHISIFDTTLCGDWAGSDDVWHMTQPGQSQSCAAKTGYSSCVDYVHNEGAAFKDAYWSIKYVKYFSSPASQKP